MNNDRLQNVTGFLSMTEQACRIVNHKKKDQLAIHMALTAENGELSEELQISHGLRKGPHGPDGVVGEAIDTILCALDIIYSEVGHLDQVFLTTIARRKLLKWIDKDKALKEAKVIPAQWEDGQKVAV